MFDTLFLIGFAMFSIGIAFCKDKLIESFVQGMFVALLCMLYIIKDEPTPSERKIQCLELKISKEKCDLISNFKKE